MRLRSTAARCTKGQAEGENQSHYHRADRCPNEFNSQGLGAVRDMEIAGIGHPSELDCGIADDKTDSKTEGAPQKDPHSHLALSGSRNLECGLVVSRSAPVRCDRPARASFSDFSQTRGR